MIWLAGTGGLRLRAYVDGAEGKPWLTCLHSLATSSALWEPQIEALTTTHRILRLDMRGHGGSEAGTAPYRFDDLVADVAAAWNQLGIARSSVLGLSIGGMVGLGLALAVPGRVERLAAADCRADAPPFFRDLWTTRQRLVSDGGLAAVADVTIATWLTAATRTADLALVDRVRAMILATSTEGYLGATSALQALAYKADLGKITPPTLLVVGAQDGPHPAEMRAMATMIPGAQFAEIPDAAHLSNMEQPAAFNAAVTSFLAA